MEIKSGAIGNKYRSSRVDYAQYSQGAKVLKFQGVEIPMVASVSDTLRQLFGFFVPRGACRVLGKHMTKNTFLAFKGNKAALKIKLNQRIFLDTIRIDHYIDDLRNPEMISAMPKDLSFYVNSNLLILFKILILIFAGLSRQFYGSSVYRQLTDEC